MNKNPKNQFKKGKSGNPKGRPLKEYSISNLLNITINKPKFVKKLLELAYAGDLPAIRLILNYVEGMPIQKIENIKDNFDLPDITDMKLTPEDTKHITEQLDIIFKNKEKINE